MALEAVNPADGIIGPKTEFAMRTFNLSHKELREILYKTEQAFLDLTMQLHVLHEFTQANKEAFDAFCEAWMKEHEETDGD